MEGEQEPNVQVERVDDVPLLLHHMKAMGMAEAIDAYVRPHGNWGEGLSIGQTLVVWLAYLLSQGDPRLCAVEAWVERLLQTLQRLISPQLRPEDLCDDRLARALRYLAKDEVWAVLEAGLGRRLLRVYALPGERVRVDASTLSTYARVTPDGLVQFGFSKDHRPDLPQVKVALATLDPLGMPLATLVLPGDRADDPVYTPLIQQVHAILGPDKMYVGDSKMAAAATRAALHRQGDVYLCPAPRTIVSEAQLSRYISEAQEEGRIQSWRIEGEDTVLEGEGFVVKEEMRVEVEGEEVVWREERWVVRSSPAHERARQHLERRLTKAETALRALNQRGRGKRRYPRQEALAERVGAILRRHEVEGLIEVTYRQEVDEREVRGYGGREDRVERREDWFVAEVRRNEDALAALWQRLGWRVYLSNGGALGRPMNAETVIQAYSGQYSVEQAFRRMKGRPVGIAPMHLHRDDHRRGLIRLFSLALRVVTVLEYSVRRALAREKKKLYGLYEGNPRRGTHRPTAERLLRAFKGLNLSILSWGTQVIFHVTPLSGLQKDILRLLGLSENIYMNLVIQSGKPS